MLKVLIGAAAIAALLTTSARADDVDYAFGLCSLFDNSNLLSQPCDVSGWGAEITIVVDMNSGEARKLCPMVSNMLSEQGIGFERDWTLQIKSPYSGDNSIAFCRL